MPAVPPATIARTPGAGATTHDYFATKGRGRSGSIAASGVAESEEPSTPGASTKLDASAGFMGRLRGLGKSSKKPLGTDAAAAPIPEVVDPVAETEKLNDKPQKPVCTIFLCVMKTHAELSFLDTKKVCNGDVSTRTSTYTCA